MTDTHTVEFTCMTTKKKFTVDDPEVIVLKNGRYAYQVPCPWAGKNGKSLIAVKFCSTVDYQRFIDSRDGQKASRLDEAESKHDEEIA